MTALARHCVHHAVLAAALVLAMPAGAVETSILLSPAPADGAEMAYAVSVDGTRVALGAPVQATHTVTFGWLCP